MNTIRAELIKNGNILPAYSGLGLGKTARVKAAKAAAAKRNREQAALKTAYAAHVAEISRR